MASFAASSFRLLHRLLSFSSAEEAPHPGTAAVLDGVSAVAVTEACISESAALAASYPAAAGARAWSRRQAVNDVNGFGQPLGSVSAESPRGAVAAAIGMAMSGQRATVFLSGPDLDSARDLLAQAAGQHLPLVIHLAGRASAAHAQALGGGHEAYAAALDCGCVQFFAASVQEAVDLTIAARRIAEQALVPVIVAMDGEQTAMAAQDVLLPGEEFVRDYLGQPSQTIEAPTDAQRLLFGDSRRRVPRMYDLERPLMLSPLQGPESWAHGRAGSRPYFESHVPTIIAEALQALGAQTGRRYTSVLAHGTDDADIVLVAQGSAVETATAVADAARAGQGSKVGVLGLSSVRPLPGAEIAACLKGSRTVAVLECLDAPLSGDGPLMRELRTALDRARENARFGESAHPGYPAVAEGEQPRLIEVAYGLGGSPLRGADLTALIAELGAPKRSLIYLGLDFAGSASAYPKRQALIDTLERSYGDLSALGLRAEGAPPALLSDDAITVAIHRLAGGERQALVGEAARLIHEAVGGHMRSRPALTWQRFEEPCSEYLIHSAEPLRDPGDDVRVDVAMVTDAVAHPLVDPAGRLKPGGVLLLAGVKTGVELWSELPKKVRDGLRERKTELRTLTIGAEEGDANGASWQATEAQLGALLSVFLERAGHGDLAEGKIRSARDAVLVDLDEEQRELRLDAFMQAFASVEPLELPADSAEEGAAGAEAPTPLALRHLGRSEDTLECLPRFWNQVGVLYGSGDTAELSVDPYLASGAIPPLSSTFRNVSGGRSVLPIFDPASADGNGSLWTSCPDGSVAPLVISAKALIDAGIGLASAKGKPVSSLRAVVSNLARRANKIVKEEGAPTVAAGLLGQAFEGVLAKIDDADRKASLEEAFRAVMGEIGALPVARTAVFFDDAERESADSGELFSLVVNPDACKCPELILAAGAGHGLMAVEQNADRVAAARQLWDLWQQLPDTSGATIERARKHPEVGPLAAMMLSRHCLLAMAGGDGAEAGSGAKAALRQVLAAAEYHLQPRLQEHLGQIESIQQKLSERVREVLADALPGDDLDALADGLDLLGRTDVDLGTLSDKVDAAVSGGRVDGARLGRLVDVARGLGNLHWHLSKGPDGLGRARAGLAIAPGAVASWSAVFPYNPFQAPAAVDASGETGQFACGLLEGQLEQSLAGLRLMRWATMELERPAEAAHEASGLARLRYSDLSEEERMLCPPVLVVGDGVSLGSRGLSQLARLLDSGLPIKAIVLGEIGGNADAGLSVDALGSFATGERNDLALLALLGRKAFVAQTSIADGDHFVDAVSRALAFDGPALVHIHAPSPQRHGFAVENLHAQARLAVDSRAFPLLIFDPTSPGVFGSCLDLSANPQVKDALGEEEGAKLTPIDWAASEGRFAAHLAPLDANEPSPTAIADYLGLVAAERDGKTPYVEVTGGEEKARLRVGEVLIADADERLRLWQTLQELAGVVTPFTEQVRADVEQELAAAHGAEIARLEQEHQAKIAELEAGFDVEATRRVTDGLMALAGYSAGNGKSDAETS